jgi:O-succinylbenzoic acid--CoA ligase
MIVDATFVRRIEAVDLADARPLPCVAVAFDDPQRIARTSGSSGRSKFMLLTRQAQEWLGRSGAESGGYRAESRLLVAGPLVMNSIFARVSVCLRMGAAVLDLAGVGLPGHDITHLVALPTLLEEVLRSLPPGYAPRQRVDVCAVGGFVAPSLRERAAQALGGRVTSRYGANEVAGIADLDANGAGVVGPGVDVRIVDEAGNDLPQGRLGMIVLRTPAMASSYLGDPESSKAAFRDGWFHSGDWGMLLAPRVLRLAGRHDDLINVGGIKVPAAQVEAQVRELVPVHDCAVLAINQDAGATSLGIALVAGGTQPRDAVRQLLAQGLKLGATVGAKVIFLSALPRVQSGKIDRVALQRLFEAPPQGSV